MAIRIVRLGSPRAKGEGLRIGVALARFNQGVTDRLLAGALEGLTSHGVADDAIDVAVVPGAFELPLCVQRLASTGRYDALICLGAVVRGETPHFDFVAGVAAHGLSRVALDTGVPVTFGVITSLTEAQAWERAGGVVGHRGEEAARAALEMAVWKRDLRSRRPTRRAPKRRD